MKHRRKVDRPEPHEEKHLARNPSSYTRRMELQLFVSISENTLPGQRFGLMFPR
jgi:hypothetical protein